MTGYDAIVVGAGTAGCVVAARLSEDPARRVLLLEEGAVPRTIADRPPELLDAARVPGAESRGAWNRWFDVRLAPGRPWRVSRGRVSGGSSATNGGYFVRARPADFERWSVADSGWSPRAVAPALARLERDLDFGGSAGHGAAGPVPVRRGPLDQPASEAFLAACVAAGHPFEDDKNGTTEHGVGAMPANVVHGVRFDAATTYLQDAIGRPNLVVRGSAAVRRVLLAHGRAAGVELAGGARLHSATVVLAAGALTTPTLLVATGVGPAADLAALGVDVVVDAPGVGASLADHPQVLLGWHPATRLPAPTAGWAGPLLDAPLGGGGDVEALQSCVPMSMLTDRRWDEDAPLPVLVSVHRPVSPGSLRVTVAGTVVEHGALADATARAALREAVRLVADVLRGSAATRRLADPAMPYDDAGLDGWIASRLGTALHTCGTVPFLLPDGGPGPVDAFGAVRGVEGLVVADTSILPTAPSRGPANTAVLLGELVAARLRGHSNRDS